MKTGIFMAALSAALLGVGHAKAATLNIDGAVLDESGTTVITTCRNTQGYYVERGTPLDIGVLVARGFSDGAPVVHALGALVPKGWRVLLGKGVSKHRRISWRGGLPWPETLRKIAHDYNLALILDWDRRELFVDAL